MPVTPSDSRPREESFPPLESAVLRSVAAPRLPCTAMAPGPPARVQAPSSAVVVSTPMTSLARDRGVPIVLFNRYVPGEVATCVRCDNRDGGRKIADALVAADGSLPETEALR